MSNFVIDIPNQHAVVLMYQAHHGTTKLKYTKMRYKINKLS